MQKVYGLIVDCGDGSAIIEWYKSTSKEELFEKIENDWERYGLNESNIIEINFPDDYDLSLGIRYFSD